MNIKLLPIFLALAACGNDAAPNGEACTADTDCASDTCVTSFADEVTVPGGLCTQTCVWNEDRSDNCPEGEMCLMYTATGEMYCFDRCETSEDCRTDEGWYCDIFVGACIWPWTPE